MKHPDENPLLKKILEDEALAALRHASLGQGLNATRRARRHTLIIRAGAIALVPALLILTLLLHKPAQEPASRPLIANIQTSFAESAPEESGVKMLSDDELFALFPDRSLALVGKPGHQQLVFLDGPVRH